MQANYLGQVLLVQRQVDFATIAEALRKLGFTLEGNGAAEPLIKGEPEVASWSFNGAKPFVIYTFNPVVSMRVLEVATVPPGLRMAIARQLPLIDEQLISNYFESPDVKERLLALWAAQETERVDLLGRVEALKADAEPVIAEQAEEISRRLGQMNQARESMLVQLRLLSETAPELIIQMREASFVAKLRPGREDLVRLFDENLLEAAQHCTESIYQQGPHITELAGNAQIEVVAAPAGLLRWPNMLSERFPGGYRDIAGWLNPRRIWLSWTISVGASRVAYDGLVWLDDKWVWLPKIYRCLTPYLITDAQASMRRH